jgi:outer membrane protein OmpA-like peptidoglycan-associated protein
MLVKVNAVIIKTIFFVCIFIFLPTGKSNAQSKKKILRKARHYADRADYVNSKIQYLKLLKKDSLSKAGNMELGLILNEYTLTPAEAGFYLKRAERAMKTDSIPELFYELGRYYHMTGNFENAKKYFNMLIKYQVSTREGILVRAVILKDIADCNYAIKNKETTNHRFYISNIGNKINSPFPEYVPVITADNNSLIFTSSRKTKNSKKIDVAEMKYFEDIFIVKNRNGQFSDTVVFLQEDKGFSKIKNSRLNEAVISISHDGKKLFFFKNRKVHESDFDGLSWSEPRVLGRNVNFNFYQNHASISPDGKIIYFTSETKKGNTGSDIYMATLDSSGKWSQAISLGNVINTPFDEDSPFIDIDGKTLYFSSDGHEGFGGYDIYKSFFDGKNWSKPVNLGQPVNSPCDDFDFTLSDEGNNGYFSSSRVGGYGDLDIYKFTFQNCENSVDTMCYFYADKTPFLDSIVTFKNKPISLPVREIVARSWFINDKLELANADALSIAFKNPGTYTIKMQVRTAQHTWCYSESFNIESTQAAHDSLLAANEKQTNNNSNDLGKNANNSNNNAIQSQTHNFSDQTNFLTNHNASDREPPVSISLSENSDSAVVYFKLDNYLLTANAKEKLLATGHFLEQHRETKINIAGYCDSRASDEYNKLLSILRVKSVINYLLKHGLDRKQLILPVRYAGESQLVNNCGNGSTCTGAEHALNRRVTIQIQK